MWNTLLGVNSFIVIPLLTVFLIYCFGRMLIFWEWKLFVVSLVLLLIGFLAEVVLSMLAE